MNPPTVKETPITPLGNQPAPIPVPQAPCIACRQPNAWATRPSFVCPNCEKRIGDWQ